MSLRIYVDAYSGFKANERPMRFWLDPSLGGQVKSGHLWPPKTGHFQTTRDRDFYSFMIE